MSMFRRRLLMQQAMSVPDPIAAYDPTGHTNEDMAEYPVLTDLTGNGHDITLNNFAWSGMSGIGGYAQDYNLFTTNGSNGSKVVITSKCYNKVRVEVREEISNPFILYIPKKYYNYNVSYKIRCFSDLSNLNLSYYSASKVIRVPLASDGKTTEITAQPDLSDTNVYIEVEDISALGYIELELIPENKGALVSDGVDDYGICENFPILTKDKGYTVCALRKIITNKGYVCSTAHDTKSGAFIFEGIGVNDTYSFGKVNNIILNPSLFTYQTSKSYNGKQITPGEAESTNRLLIFGGLLHNLSNIALYALEIYDRDLTPYQIEAVKKRMIADYEKATGNVLGPTLDPSLVDAWIFSGLKNYDAPEFITGEKGIQLEAHNFAWNEEGSGFKDGALWFDGVDDYLVTTETIIAKEDRFTIICKRNIHTTSNHNAIISNNASWTNNHSKFAFEVKYNVAYVIANGKSTLIEEGFPEIISWMTDSSYNGIPIDNVSDILNYQKGMVLGADGIDWVRGSVDMNIYYFAIYRSALTEPQIQAEIQKLETLWLNRLNN